MQCGMEAAHHEVVIPRGSETGSTEEIQRVKMRVQGVYGLEYVYDKHFDKIIPSMEY